MFTAFAILAAILFAFRWPITLIFAFILVINYGFFTGLGLAFIAHMLMGALRWALLAIAAFTFK